MNEEANFCDQCGSKINSDAKFCSNCGYDLQNSSTKTSLDANIKLETANVKLETTNATLEKGVKATGKGLQFSLTSLKKTIKPIVKILTLGAILYGIAFVGFDARESYLKRDRDKAIQDLNLKIATAQGAPNSDLEWDVFGKADPASGKKIGGSATIRSNDDLCRMMVIHEIDGDRLTVFDCRFEFRSHLSSRIRIKFDNDNNVYTMLLNQFSEARGLITDKAYVMPDKVAEANKRFDFMKKKPDSISYENFIYGLISAKAVAIEVTPAIQGHEYDSFINYATGRAPYRAERNYWSKFTPVWIRFSLKGAKEAIDKLGKELETAPNISND